MTFDRVRAVLYEPVQAHQVLGSIWRAAKPWLIAQHKLHIDVRSDTRSLAQNRLMWWRLKDLSEQVSWYGETLTDTEWKDAITATLKKQRVIPALEGGGFIVLGGRTSEMTVAEMTAVLDFAEAFGAQRGVKFREDLGESITG